MVEIKLKSSGRSKKLETAAGAVDAAVVNNATLNEEHRDCLSAR